MKTLDRYIAGRVLVGYGIVLLALLALLSFFALNEQLEDVGGANYEIADALLYVFLTTPGRVLELAPATVLLGSLVAVVGLLQGTELVVIRASGVSVRRLEWSFCRPVLPFIALLLLLSQFAVPVSHGLAENLRARAASDIGDVLRGRGLWSRDALRFANVRVMRHGRVPTGVELYEFDPSGRLLEYVYAETADISPAGIWRLNQVDYKALVGQTLRHTRIPHMEWKPFWNPRQLVNLQLPAASLAPTDLFYYARYLERTGQTADRIWLTLWRKLALPVSCLAMAALALPLVLVWEWRRGVAQHLATGALVGVVFYLLSQIVTNLGLLWGLNAWVVTLAPPLTVALCAMLLLGRVR